VRDRQRLAKKEQMTLIAGAFAMIGFSAEEITDPNYASERSFSVPWFLKHSLG
jgi:hypothetical protein